VNVTIGDVFAFLNQLIPVLLGIGVLYVGLRRWIKKLNEAQASATHQLKTSNGTTVAGYVEKSSKNIDKLSQEMTKTKATVNLLHQRLDEHMIRDHGVRVHVKEDEEDA
jgi:predicted negative regulator of RcsB-dependent stress response